MQITLQRNVSVSSSAFFNGISVHICIFYAFFVYEVARLALTPSTTSPCPSLQLPMRVPSCTPPSPPPSLHHLLLPPASTPACPLMLHPVHPLHKQQHRQHRRCLPSSQQTSPSPLPTLTLTPLHLHLPLQRLLLSLLPPTNLALRNPPYKT
jgi:hypothetical protein